MSVLYVDSSALLKRVLVEPESNRVERLLRDADSRGDLLAASSLAWLELWRALRRTGVPSTAHAVRVATAGVAEFPLSDGILLNARSVGSDILRSLDAIHLASALAIEADTLLTYDTRLANAATIAGVAVVAPR